jgi:hypothetical protein
MNQWENMYIEIYHQYGQLIEEKQVHEINQLFSYARTPNTIKSSASQNEQRQGIRGSNVNR